VIALRSCITIWINFRPSFHKLGGSWLLPPWDFPHQMRVTLWITTAIHLNMQNVLPAPGDNSTP